MKLSPKFLQDSQDFALITAYSERPTCKIEQGWAWVHDFHGNVRRLTNKMAV
jgi:hypothetical protein